MDPVLPRIGKATYPFFFQMTSRNGDADQDFGGLGIHGQVSGTPPVVIMSPTRWTITPTITDRGSHSSCSGARTRTAVTMRAEPTQSFSAPPRPSFRAFVANATKARKIRADPAGISPSRGTDACERPATAAPPATPAIARLESSPWP